MLPAYSCILLREKRERSATGLFVNLQNVRREIFFSCILKYLSSRLRASSKLRIFYICRCYVDDDCMVPHKVLELPKEGADGSAIRKVVAACSAATFGEINPSKPTGKASSPPPPQDSLMRHLHKYHF
jgi:hypothetical protein